MFLVPDPSHALVIVESRKKAIALPALVRFECTVKSYQSLPA